MLPNVSELRRTHERLNDAQLLRLATGLRLEALEVVRQIIAGRVLDAVDAVSAAIAVN